MDNKFLESILFEVQPSEDLLRKAIVKNVAMAIHSQVLGKGSGSKSE